MIQKYHVYILGAGASYHAGLPVLSDFFHKAEKLCEGNHAKQPACTGYQSAIEKVREYRQINKSKCQVQNIEDVYRLALENNEKEILDSLDNIILGLLDLHGCLVNYDGKQYKPNRLYENFLERLYSVSDYGGWPRRDNVDSIAIITFNWDCLIDYAMSFNTITPYYGLGEFNKPNTPKLLKMHGSVNWSYCKQCNSGLQITRVNDFVGNRWIRKPVEFDLRIISEGIGRKKCKCNYSLSPKIVPPTYNKALTDDIKHVWNLAKDLIIKAEKITLVGYSFPQTDTDFLNLIDEALNGNIDLMNIEVINPSCNDVEFQNNYRNNFRKYKDKIKFIPNTFEQYVNSL